MGRCSVVVPYQSRVLPFSLPDGVGVIDFVSNPITETTLMIIEGPMLPEWKPGYMMEPVVFNNRSDFEKYIAELPVKVSR